MRPDDKKVLVIGCGSIGSRHAAIFADMGYAVACVTRRSDVPWTVFRDIATGLKKFQQNMVVIATPSIDHLAAYNAVMSTDYAGCLMVEKPLFAQIPPLVPIFHKYVFVGYNLRFHPVVQAIRTRLSGKKFLQLSFLWGSICRNGVMVQTIVNAIQHIQPKVGGCCETFLTSWILPNGCVGL